MKWAELLFLIILLLFFVSSPIIRRYYLTHTINDLWKRNMALDNKLKEGSRIKTTLAKNDWIKISGLIFSILFFLLLLLIINKKLEDISHPKKTQVDLSVQLMEDEYKREVDNYDLIDPDIAMLIAEADIKDLDYTLSKEEAYITDLLQCKAKSGKDEAKIEKKLKEMRQKHKKTLQKRDDVQLRLTHIKNMMCKA